MEKFKKGDRVMCISSSSELLKEKEIYTVINPNYSVYPGLISVKEIHEMRWYASRFKLHNPNDDLREFIF